MLTRIKVCGYKSLADVEFKLQPLTVLFGPNAAGKSNLLDALQLVARLVNSQQVNAVFDPPYRGTPLESFTFGVEGVRGMVQEDVVSLSIEIDVRLATRTVEDVNRLAGSQAQQLQHGNGLAGLDRYARDRKSPIRREVQEKYLRYYAALELRPKTGIVSVVEDRLTALTKFGEPKAPKASYLAPGEVSFFAMQGHGEGLPSRLSLRFPVALFPHMYALQQELSSWAFFYFEPRERMREPNAVRETRQIGMMGENLAAFLNTLQAVAPADFKSLELALQMLVPSITGIDVGVNDRGEVELRLLEGRTPIPASVLSEGTLRLLGLLALEGAKERPTLIGFEEPENGIHPRRIRLIAELLKAYADAGDTQMIVTTHSPVLLDALPRKSLYVCRKVARHTTIRSLAELDSIGREMDIANALNDTDDELTVSERILRGDFDA